MGLFDDVLGNGEATTPVKPGLFDDVLKPEQDSALAQGIFGVKNSLATTKALGIGDFDEGARLSAERAAYARANPGSKEGIELSKAWESGDGITGGVSNVLGEIKKDWNEPPSVIGGIRATANNLSAMGSGIVKQVPNMVLPMAGMLAGGAAGGAAGSAVPVVGNLAGAAVGAWAGATAGNAAMESSGQVDQALQKAGINPEDKVAVSEFLNNNGDSILGSSIVKGGIIGAVDTATMGVGSKLLTAPAKAAAEKTLIGFGVDVANKEAVAAARQSPAINAAINAAVDATEKGIGNTARNVTAAALEPGGEFAGEYLGEGVANKNWDEKNAFLEAASSVGQSALTFAGQKAYQAITSPTKRVVTDPNTGADVEVREESGALSKALATIAATVPATQQAVPALLEDAVQPPDLDTALPPVVTDAETQGVANTATEAPTTPEIEQATDPEIAGQDVAQEAPGVAPTIQADAPKELTSAERMSLALNAQAVDPVAHRAVMENPNFDLPGKISALQEIVRNGSKQQTQQANVIQPTEGVTNEPQAAEKIQAETQGQKQQPTPDVSENDLLEQATRQAFKDDAAVTQAIDRAKAENATQADQEAATKAVTDAFARNPEIGQNAYDILQSLRTQAETQRSQEQPATGIAPAEILPSTTTPRQGILDTDELAKAANRQRLAEAQAARLAAQQSTPAVPTPSDAQSTNNGEPAPASAAPAEDLTGLKKEFLDYRVSNGNTPAIRAQAAQELERRALLINETPENSADAPANTTSVQPAPVTPGISSVKQMQDEANALDSFSPEYAAIDDKLKSAVHGEAKASLDAGEMPVFRTNGGTVVSLHPSSSSPGMIQATRYNDTGAIGDSQYASIEQAIDGDQLHFATRIPNDEANVVMAKAAEAEQVYQAKRKAYEDALQAKKSVPVEAPAQPVAQQPAVPEALVSAVAKADSVIAPQSNAKAIDVAVAAKDVGAKVVVGKVAETKANIADAVEQIKAAAIPTAEDTPLNQEDQKRVNAFGADLVSYVSKTGWQAKAPLSNAHAAAVAVQKAVSGQPLGESAKATVRAVLSFAEGGVIPGNKIFTPDMVAAARARMKAKLGRLNAGLDPEMIVDGTILAGAYIESGIRTFSAYSQAMIADFGEKIRPYLRSFYEAARYYPGLETEGMTTAVEIDAVKTVPVAPKNSASAKLTPIQRRDDLVGAIMRVTGGRGILASEALTIIGDTANNATKLRGLFTKEGIKDLGSIAKLLRDEEHYDVADREALSEMIREASKGNAAVSMVRVEQDAEDAVEKEHRDRIRKLAKKYGIRSVAVKFSKVEQDVYAMMSKRHEKAVSLLSDRSLARFNATYEQASKVLSEDVLDAVLTDVQSRGFHALNFWNESTKIIRGMIRDAQLEVQHAAIERSSNDWLNDDNEEAGSNGRGNPEAGSGEVVDRGDQAQTPGFGLEQQTPEQVRQQEADRVAEEAEQARAEAQESADKREAEKQSLEDAIKARAANPDNFQFGEGGKEAALPMGGLFDQPAIASQDTKERLSSEQWRDEGMTPEQIVERKAEGEASELAGQIYQESKEEDFDPKESIIAAKNWAKDSGIPEDVMLNALRSAIEKSPAFRRKAGVLAALKPQTKLQQIIAQKQQEKADRNTKADALKAERKAKIEALQAAKRAESIVPSRADRIEQTLNDGGKVVGHELRMRNGMTQMTLTDDELASIPESKKITSKEIKDSHDAVYGDSSKNQEKLDTSEKPAQKIEEPAQVAPEWHTVLPSEGLPITDAQKKSGGYNLVPNVLAADAYNAVTQNQRMNAMPMYAYYLPAEGGRNGIVRLIHDDQNAPKPWKLLSGEAVRVFSQPKEQIVAKLTEWLRSAPILGDEKAAVQPSKPAAVAPSNAKPSAGTYRQPASSASRDGQMALAQRGGRIASLLMMNEQVAKIDASKAYSNSEIENAATENLDAMQDWLSSASVNARPKDMEKYIKVAADSIKELRKADVFRVLVESNRKELQQDLAAYIKAERPDLAAEVDSVMEEENGAAPVSSPKVELVDYAYDFAVRPVEIQEYLIDTGNIKALFESAGVKSADAFDGLPMDDRSEAYAKYVADGGKPAPAATESYNDKVMRMEREAVVRRLQSDSTVRQANGKPFKTEASAKAFSASYELDDTHKAVKVVDGFVLNRLGEAQRPSVLKAIEERQANDPEMIRQEAAFERAKAIGESANESVEAYENGDTTIEQFEAALSAKEMQPSNVATGRNAIGELEKMSVDLGQGFSTNDKAVEKLKATNDKENPAGSIEDAKSRYSVSVQVGTHFLAGKGFDTIIQGRAFVAGKLGIGRIEAGTQEAKYADEIIEAGIVDAARNIISTARQANKTPDQIYTLLTKLYERQPRLGVRTSTSMREQAYSTPAPLAYLASELAGIDENTHVYEPTAGNGMLLIGAKSMNVIANELNKDRFDSLKQMFPTANVVNGDALTHTIKPGSADVMIANPPFGIIKDSNGETVIFDTAVGYPSREIDHAIAFKALESIPNHGRSVLIVGGVRANSDEERKEGYRAKSKREFYFNLYNNYKVENHFTVNGDLYEKQGAGYPVDVIVISGRGKSERILPAAHLPVIYNSWGELKEVLNENSNLGAKGSERNDADSSSGSSGGNNGKSVDRGAIGSSSENDNVGGRPATGTPSGSKGANPSGGNIATGGNSSVRGGNTGEAQSGLVGTNAQTQSRVPADSQEQRVRAGTDGQLGKLGGSSVDGSASVSNTAPDRRGKEAETDKQVAYSPRSKSSAVGTLVPINMRDAVQDSLDSLEQQVGDLDEYVASRLDFSTKALANSFSAEQVDALAMAINNAENGGGFIIGDQTGIGKGRIVAGMIRYSIMRGLTPIFVTEKPNLYADMLRDLSDIGMKDAIGYGTDSLRVLMTNSTDAVPYGNDGEFEIPRLKGKASGVFKQMANDGKLPKEYSAVFTTYNQLQTVKGEVTDRMNAIRALAPNAYLILDESHNAGGTGTEDRMTAKQKAAAAKNGFAGGRAGFMRLLVNKSKASFFSSATYAKRPNVMDLYSSTNMSLAVDKPSQLGDAIARGGVPLQQVVASMLAQDGQYMRRERSFAGVEYNTGSVTVDKQVAENMASAMSRVLQLSRMKDGAIQNLQDEYDAAGAMMSSMGNDAQTSVTGANFGSIMHNLIDQMLLSLKAKGAVSEAVKALERGEKVVMTVANTMGSFIKDYADDMGLNVGDPVNLSFNDLYRKYLEKQRWVRIKDGNGVKSEYRLTDKDLGPFLAKEFRDTDKWMSESDFGGSPISPIDYMHSELRKHKINGRSITTDEITGRTATIEYSGAVPVLASRKASIKVRLSAINGFNGGSVDVLILNQAGSTGLSLHASEKFKDQRKRNMILVQAEKNIDTHMQILGRVHRTGQVLTPSYLQLMADIPAEMRPAAVLLGKMAKLSANTTASKDSDFSADGITDFINDYGGQVAVEFLLDNPDVYRSLGGSDMMALSQDEAGEHEIRKLSGYIPLLPIAQQEKIYAELIGRYNELVKRETELGTNKLEARALDLDADTISSSNADEGRKDSKSLFAAPVSIERVSVKRTSKPLTQEQVRTLVNERREGKTGYAIAREMATKLSEDSKAFIEDYRMKHAESGEDLSRIESGVEVVRGQTAIANQKLYEYEIGSQHSFNLDGQIFYGIVTDVKHHNRSANPAALSTWTVQFALAMSDANSVSLPFSQLGNKFKTESISGTSWGDLATGGSKWVSTYELFDLAQTSAREKRWMVTGNLLSGYAKFPGQLVHYTKNDGSTSQGILMGRNYDYAKHKEMMGSRLKNVNKIMSFFDKAQYKAVITDANQILRIEQIRPGEFILTIPASKRQGGLYSLDSELTNILRGDFVSSGGGQMKLKSYSVSDVKSAIEHVLGDQTDHFTAITHKDIATKISDPSDSSASKDAIPKPDDGNGVDQDNNNVHSDINPDRWSKRHADAAYSRAVDRAIADEMGHPVEPTRKPAVLSRLKKILDNAFSGEYTEGRVVNELSFLTQSLMNASAEKSILQDKERTRGADFFRQKLLEAKRRGDISAQESDFAEWMALKNPGLLDDLAVSIKTADNGYGAGNYNPAMRLATLFKGHASDGTAVHEVLHHLERMLPENLRTPIMREYLKRIASEMKTSTGKRKEMLTAIMEANAVPSRAAVDKAVNLMEDYADYHLLNASEFWAVNGARILKAKFDAKDSSFAKIKQWMIEVVQKLRALFGLKSDAAILRALDSALNGDGKFVSNAMLSDATVFNDADKAPVFISQLAEAFKNAPDRMFTNGNSIRLWLAGNAPKLGIKSDEIAWSGILDYLEMRGKDKVTKDEIAAYLSENGTQVKDVVLGGIVRDEINKVRDKYASILERVTSEQDAQTMADAIATWASDYDARDERAPSQIVEDKERGYELLRTAIDDDEIDGNEIHDAVDAAKAEKEDTKFSEYAVPGGENYRELLVTIPDTARDKQKALYDEMQELETPYMKRGEDLPADVVEKRNALKDKIAALSGKLVQPFSSDHFDQKNILVHLRMDERADADGNPTLFVQEIQSDFAQSYRKQQKAIGKAVDAGFLDIVERMKKDGVLEVNCN